MRLRIIQDAHRRYIVQELRTYGIFFKNTFWENYYNNVYNSMYCRFNTLEAAEFFMSTLASGGYKVIKEIECG